MADNRAVTDEAAARSTPAQEAAGADFYGTYTGKGWFCGLRKFLSEDAASYAQWRRADRIVGLQRATKSGGQGGRGRLGQSWRFLPTRCGSYLFHCKKKHAI